MLESGKNNNNDFRGINTIGAGIHQVFKAKYSAPAPVPALIERTQQPQPKRLEVPRVPTRTLTEANGIEVCSRCKSHNQLYTAAMKTMTCVVDVFEMCGKRGHIKDNCFSNPDSPWYRQQGAR